MFKAASKKPIDCGESLRNCWQTPRSLFNTLHRVFPFTVDACASQCNALLPYYWTQLDDCLVQDWTRHIVFCNPPFSIQKLIPQKAATARQAVVFLYHTGLFTRFLAANPPSHIIFTPKRIRFIPPNGVHELSNPPFGVAICVYGGLTNKQLQSLATLGLVLHSQQDGGTPMSLHLSEKDLARANLTVNGDGTEIISMPPAEQPTERMTDDELVAYAAKQDGIYRDLSCRAVISFFRRGWALSIIFERHKGRWTAFCEEHGIGRTWATHARKFFAHYKEESAIPAGKTLNELLVALGIIRVQKVNDLTPKPKPKPEDASGGNKGDGDANEDGENNPQPEPDEVPPAKGENGTEGSEKEARDESPESDEGPPAKENTLLLFLTKVKALLDDRYLDRDKFDWTKEDLGTCKEMAFEIIQCCDDWINEVDSHALRKAS